MGIIGHQETARCPERDRTAKLAGRKKARRIPAPEKAGDQDPTNRTSHRDQSGRDPKGMTVHPVPKGAGCPATPKVLKGGAKRRSMIIREAASAFHSPRRHTWILALGETFQISLAVHLCRECALFNSQLPASTAPRRSCKCLRVRFLTAQKCLLPTGPCGSHQPVPAAPGNAPSCRRGRFLGDTVRCQREPLPAGTLGLMR